MAMPQEKHEGGAGESKEITRVKRSAEIGRDMKIKKSGN
jgi:hypothetical protein